VEHPLQIRHNHCALCSALVNVRADVKADNFLCVYLMAMRWNCLGAADSLPKAQRHTCDRQPVRR